MGVQVEGTAKVKVDGQEAGQQIEKLQDKAKNLRKEIRALRKQEIVDEAKIKKLQQQLKKTNQETRALKKQTFDYNQVLNNLSGASIKDLTRLQSKLNFETKLLGRNTTEYVQKSKQLSLVKAEMAQIRAEMSGVNKQGSVMGRMADGFNRYMGFIAGFAAAFAGVILGIRSFITSFNEFEERVDNLQALTGLAGDKLKYLEDQALSMSTTTTEEGVRITQSATDIVDAFTKVGSQRPELLRNKEALAAVTKDAIILSQAAKTQLEPATVALTTSLNQFNASANDSRRYINAIAAGSQVGAADIPYLSQAIEKVGTTANLMNIEFEETIGIIEAVAPYYKEAATSGNSLDKVLMKMKATQIGYKSGTFDLNDAIDELRIRFNNGESAASIFGAEHAKMGELLVQNQDKFNYYTKEVTGTNTAIEQAVINTDNNNAKLAQAKNRTEASAIALGEKLAPALTMSTNGMNYLLKALTHIVENFGIYKKIIVGTVATIGTYILVTKGAVIAKNIYTKAVNAAKAAQAVFNKTMKANPWGLVLSAVVAVGTAVWAFADSLREASARQKIMDDIARETNKRFEEESFHLEKLKGKLEDTNITQKDRAALIKEINSSYGQYLPKLLDENASLQDIEKAYAQINQQLKKKIQLQVKEEKAKEIAREIEDRKANMKKELSETLDPKDLMDAIENFGNPKEYIEAKKKRLEGDIQELQNVFNELTSDITKQSTVEDLTSSSGSNSGSSGSPKAKQAESLKDYIQNLNLQLLEDERQKAKMEVDIWKQKELDKISKATAAASEKAQAVEAIEALHKKKLTDLDAGYNKELEKRLSETEAFLKKQNDSLLNQRQDIIDKEVEAIAAKYDKQIELANEASQQESELSEEFAQKAIELEQLKTEEINAFKVQKERELAEEITAAREEYGLVTDEEYYSEEIEKLNTYYEEGLILADEYELALADIKERAREADLKREEDYLKKKFKKYQEGIRKQQAITDVLGNYFAASKEAELATVGDNEEAKKEIMKSYADKEFTVKASQIIASTAMAVMQAWAQLGPIGGPIAAGIITATGALQLKTANEERKKLKGLASGGFFEVEREQDGRLFNAALGSSGGGYYHRPSILVGEEGTEYVIPNTALQNPEISRFVQAIEQNRLNGGFQHFSYGKAIESTNKVRGFAEGGYTGKASGNAENKNTQDQELYSLLVALLEAFQAMRSDINQWQSSIEVFVEIQKIRDAMDEINEIETDVTLK